ncbi:MAG: hypothetical protein WCO25_02120 [Candidatus Uhrbacteria bacterium]
MPKTRSLLKNSLAASFACAMALLVAHPALALGLSPSSVIIPDVMRGIPQNVTVHLLRSSDQEGELKLNILAVGDAAEYLRFEPAAIIPSGMDGIDYTFQVDPGIAQSGSHKGVLSFMNSRVGAGGAATGDQMGMGVLTGVALEINFAVSGKELVSFEIRTSHVDDTESNLHPFVTYVFANTGNVNWKPYRAELAFSNKNDPSDQILYSLESDKFDSVGPGKEGNVRIELDRSLPEGTYSLTTKFFNEQKEQIGELTSFDFNVFAPGTMAQSGELVSVSTKKDSFELGEKVPVDAVFSNTGDIVISGLLMGELYKDGAYVDLIRGEEVSVGPGESSNLSLLLDPKDPGRYSLTTYVKFGNKKTLSKDVVLTVNEAVALKTLNSYVGIGVLSVVILLFVLLIVIVRRRRHGKEATAKARPTEQSPSPVVTEVRSAAVPPAEKIPDAPIPSDAERRW